MIHFKNSLLLADDLAENSVHAVITDPPYGLHLMGQSWDKILPPQKVWDACYKVMRPGAFCLAFGHTRLYHRLGCQLEDAGFVIKDCLCWTYASGFPKSLDVSKKIDDLQGGKRQVVGTVKRWGANASGGRGNQRANQYQPSVKGAVKYDDITVPATDDAKQWKGWGTALKTAWEPIVLAQKPIEGNYAKNVLKYKVGVLNIDECRIPYASEKDKKSLESFLNFEGADHGDGRYFSANQGGKKQVNVHPDGRWPANLMWLDPLFADYNHIFMVPKPSKKERRKYNDHTTVKPVELMERLIRLVTPHPWIVKEDVVVLDPFMGSGSTGVAVRNLGRTFEGYENDRDSYDVARQRLNEQKTECIDLYAS